MALEIRPRSAVRVCGVLGLVLVAGATVRPAARQSAPAQSPAGASVQIDFGAVSADGRPVLDLKVEELSLRVDGKARVIHAISLVQTPGAQTGHDAGLAIVPAPYSTNVAVDTGRTVVLVIDDESIRAGSERGLQQAAGQFLAGLSVRDRVAVITVPHGSMKVDLTSDFDKVRAALGQITGQAPETETLTDAACRTRSDLQSLTGLLDSLGGGQGPVTVVFFEESMTSSRTAITMSRGSASAPTGGTLPGANTIGACDLQPEEFNRVGAAAAQARAHFYIIQPELRSAPQFINPSGATTAASRTGGDTVIRGTNSIEEGLQDLAGVTGGERFPLTGTGDNALIRVALETSAYYTVTFDPEDAERNGAIHKVDLKVSRPDVTLRVLPSVVIPPVNAPAAAATTDPRTMLGDMRAYRDLALRSAGYTARFETGNQVKIVAVFEPDDPLATLTSAMAGLFDSSGKLVHTWKATPENLSRTPVAAALVAAPGQYRLRVAATDKSGRSGATDIDIDASLIAAGPLKISSLVLGNTKDSTFTPKLQFTDEAVAIAYLELYGTVPDGKVVVMFQVAKSEDGPAFLVQPAAIDETRDPDRFIVQAAIPIGALPPGDYVVRALVGAGVEGEPMGRATRTLRKTSK